MLFNTRRPTTLAELAKLYTGNPNQSPEEVDSSVFLGSSQGRDYLHEQANNLGIGDPVQYFSQALQQHQMQSQPNGAQMEALRQAGQLGESARLSARDKMFPMPQGTDLARLQQATLERQYPLPTPGAPVGLSPLMQEDMASKGIADPQAYILQQRLGANRGMVAPFNQVQAGGINAQDLYHTPTFQAAMQAHPEKAAGVFSALTGTDLGQFHTSQIAAQAKEVDQGGRDLHDALREGRARVNDDGSISWRELTPDPTTGKLGLGANYGAGDAYQRSLAKYLPRVSSSISEFQRLAAKGGQSAPVANLQPQVPGIPPASLQYAQQTGQAIPVSPQMEQVQMEPRLREHSFAEGYRGVANQASNLASFFTGKSPSFHAEAPLNLDNTSLAFLGTPQWKAWARANPAQARARLLKLQEDRDQLPARLQDGGLAGVGGY